MEQIVIVVHMVVAASIIGMILLQQGKGAEMGASFGSGSSNTVFGAQGTGTVFSRATAILTAVFFCTSIWLALIAKQNLTGNIEEGIPAVDIIEEQAAGQPEFDEPIIIDDAMPAADDVDVPIVDEAITEDVPQVKGTSSGDVADDLPE